jgi:hypothetical protein
MLVGPGRQRFVIKMGRPDDVDASLATVSNHGGAIVLFWLARGSDFVAEDRARGGFVGVANEG